MRENGAELVKINSQNCLVNEVLGTDQQKVSSLTLQTSFAYILSPVWHSHIHPFHYKKLQSLMLNALKKKSFNLS